MCVCVCIEREREREREKEKRTISTTLGTLSPAPTALRKCDFVRNIVDRSARSIAYGLTSSERKLNTERGATRDFRSARRSIRFS